MGDELEVTVKRWKRYGMDRLYVSGSDQVKVGWWDLASDSGHPEAPELHEVLVRAVERWRSEATDLAPAPQVSPAPAGPTPVATSSVAEPWIDLATNRAGASAREQATALREAAPFRTTMSRVLGVHTDERAWRIGADGEQKVAAQLAKLTSKDSRWRALHAIPVGRRGADIDHLVVGPGGVFTINSKHHPGATIAVSGETVTINGYRQRYVRHARAEAQRAASLLQDACGTPVHVHGLVVTVGAGKFSVRTQPEGVTVVPRSQLRGWLSRLGPVCDEQVVDTVFEAARRSTTWRR